MPFIAARLRELRQRHELTQEQVASLAGVGFKYYQSLESGRKKQMWVETVARFSECYGIGLHEFFAPELTAESRVRRAPPKSPHYKK